RELWVNVDRTLVEQAFFNLIANAADAIIDKGKITVRTNVIELIDKRRKEVIVVVEDDGPGIPEEVRTRIFEPFFTTKEQGKGTGLGLSIVYTILERHGGKISFESEIGKGTKFFVGLPLV
ncbi:MAG TPA: ATP-binding protein, partial [Candidatus Omnitrophota bacterium]|nr:ATP-binding protein [Candidatus Omnitrophota bacterium]